VIISLCSPSLVGLSSASSILNFKNKCCVFVWFSFLWGASFAMGVFAICIHQYYGFDAADVPCRRRRSRRRSVGDIRGTS
jgi:hypothetical protein